MADVPGPLRGRDDSARNLGESHDTPRRAAASVRRRIGDG